MKKKSSIAEEFKRTVDPSAETVEEIAAASGMSASRMFGIVRERVASGAWERVWKRGRIGAGFGLVPAYRRSAKAHNRSV